MCNLLLETIKTTPKNEQGSSNPPKDTFLGDLEVISEPWPASGQVLASRLVRLLLLSLFSSLSASIFNTDHLKNQAEIAGFGYKTANLLVLKELAYTINKAVPTHLVTVPDFIGLPNESMQQFLKTQGLDLPTQWQIIIASAAGPLQQKKMYKNKQLSTKFRQELETLQKRITQACEQASANTLANLSGSRIGVRDDSNGAVDFLKTAVQSNWQLMVRSTGKEDSETLANAGGNVSVANVPPRDTYVMRAIGEVLASYVSTKSMQQRLQAGDTTIFDTPFLPVLIQRMIGEPIGGAKDAAHIPTGCVLYTRETDGFTPGVALVQATFGHNEGVVQSSMPIDTFYLCRNITYASIKIKTKRLVPGIEKQLYTILEQPNTEDIVAAPSLSQQTLKSLFIVAQEVEQFYGKPMDLELVVMPHEQTIYLVQARPIVMPKHKETARYIRDISQFKATQRIPCTIINSNRGMLLTSVDSDQIIMAKSLEKALADFNELSDGKDDIQVIAVEDEAETTSHAAAVFRGEGKVIIRMADGIKQLEDIMTQPKAHIAISTQQGMIIDLTSSSPLSQDDVAQGLTSHPANLPLSICGNASLWSHFYLSSNTHYDVNKLLLKLKNNHTDRTTLRTICKAVGQQDLYTIDASLQNSTQEVQHAMRKKRSILHNFVGAITDEITQAPHKEQRIFHLRMLELALTQQPNAGYSHTYSHESLHTQGVALSSFLNQVIAPALAKKQISSAFVHNATILSQAQDGYNRCLTEMEQQAWFTFLDTHARNKKADQYLTINTLLTNLTEHDLLSGWINTSLVQAMSRANSKISDALSFEFNSAQNQLTPLNKILATMAAIQPTEWENPKKFDALFTHFDLNVLIPLQDVAFEDLLELCETIDNNVLKLAVITALKKITDRYDLFVKAIKGSTQYPNKKLKITHFHSMLEGYVRLLDKVCSNQNLIHALNERLENYDAENEDELVVSSHFNVNVVIQQTMLENGFNQQRFFDYIESLEDLFTSTHQVLLNEIGKKIVAWNITSSLNQPKLVAAIEDVLELEDHLTGIRFEGSQVIFTYNRQLRAHSIQIEICYDCSTKKVILSYHFYGINEFLRWNLIKDYITLISPKLDLDINHIVLRDYGLSLYWNVPSANKAQALDDLLEDAIDVTFELSIENRKTIFDRFDTTLETLFEKCSQRYGSSEALTKHFSTTSKDLPFNFLTLPALDDIAQTNPATAKIVFQQGLKVAEQILDSENHDTLVTAHYILAEIAGALDEIDDDRKTKIVVPKRVRLGTFRSYNKVVTKLFGKVKAAIDEISPVIPA